MIRPRPPEAHRIWRGGLSWRQSGTPFSATPFRHFSRRQTACRRELSVKSLRRPQRRQRLCRPSFFYRFRCLPDRLEGIGSDSLFFPSWTLVWASVAPSSQPRRKELLSGNNFTRYSLDRLPNDPKLRQRAAELLRKQGKEDLAREVEVRGQ
jgi:hypothetical protein